MATPKQATLSDFFKDETGRVSASLTMEAEKDPAEQARAHWREIAAMIVRAAVALASFVLVYKLAALFLEHEKPDQAEKVIAGFLGFLGGLGVGVSGMGRKAAGKD